MQRPGFRRRLFPWVLTLGVAATAAEIHTFKFPEPATFLLEESGLATPVWGVSGRPAARASAAPIPPVQFGARVVLQLVHTNALSRLAGGSGLEVVRVIEPDVFILRAPNVRTAAAAAQRWAALPEVRAAYPVVARPADWHGPYHPLPTDFFFDKAIGGSRPEQWYLENRYPDGSAAGVDLNVLAAWPFTRGEGVTLAVADCGVELAHVELAARAAGQPHFNFATQTTNGNPPLRNCTWAHGTRVAGLAVATLNNARMVGVAPGARLASWVIFQTNNLLVDDERLMDMYQFAAEQVAVQNHSWGGGALGPKRQVGPTLLERIGLQNAVLLGRSGRGVVMVRAAGNGRAEYLARADDDGYVNDPQAIGVAAVTMAGRATEYSEPGACVLVAAPGGVTGSGLFTADLLGTDGCNAIGFGPPFEDMNAYGWGALGFVGTSAAAPQIAGLAALILAANPNLGYRDVQQILALSARQFDLADPELTTNAAGFVVSPKTGFGVPDAGHAVWLARQWPPRPALTTVSLTTTQPAAIPDDGLRVLITGEGVPPGLTSIPCLPAAGGPHPDAPTAAVPLVDVGLATNVPPMNLTNRAALIRRGEANFSVKIANAAAAGAAFAVVYNSVDDELMPMLDTDFVPIPAVFIGRTHGEALRELAATNAAARARLRLHGTNLVFDLHAPMLCEHVGVRLQIEHPLRGDLRITLLSPGGTRSVLQTFNDDNSPASPEWTYWSTHHFFEPGAGRWTVTVSDQAAGATGVVRSATLILRGVQLTDADRDGLDDVWELTHFGHLGWGARDDPDRDGFSNAREQVMGSHPALNQRPFRLDLDLWSRWGNTLVRISWPSAPGVLYSVGARNALDQPASSLTLLPGRLWETEFFAPTTNLPMRFYRVSAPLDP